MPIKTFKGRLGTGGQDRIYLAGGDGNTGYRIAKFQVISGSPAGQTPEAVIQIFKEEQASALNTIDFKLDSLLAAVFYENNSSTAYFGGTVIIFDKEVVNQDLYITCNSTEGDINYYLELEEVKMSDNETAVVNFVAALQHT